LPRCGDSFAESATENSVHADSGVVIIVFQAEDDDYDNQHVLTYNAGDLYNPAASFSEPKFMSKVEARQPLKPQPFVVLETPFAGNFR